MQDARLRKDIDLVLLLFTYAIAFLGVLIIYSATHGDPTPYHKRQLIWIFLGTIGLVAAASVDYHIYPRFSKYFYAANILSLLFVMKFGHSTNGATRWVKIGGFPFQPSEFAKIFIILTLAPYIARRIDSMRDPKTLFKSFLYIAAPMLLIFRQPDLGTSLVVATVWLGMVYIAGADLKHLAVTLLAAVVLFAVAWHVGIIKQYQKDRLSVFLNPEAHAGDIGYHVMQARVAIGSGQVWGKGFLRGTMVHGGYIPEKQTDFIFTNVGEEFGFVGAVVVTLLYAGLLYRGVMIIAAADEDILGKLIATGIVTMLAFHVVENIGMNIGVMPVAGVPLPLISAGGSNVILTLTSIGILESVLRFRHQLLF